MSIEVVRRVKADLELAGVDLSGPCGAFQITKRVAWQLRATGAGLLFKPGGNNCEERSVDYIVFETPAGVVGVDMLGDAGGANSPAWNPDPMPDPALAGRWREPADPGDVPQEPPQPGEPGQPEPPASDLEARVADLESRLASLLATVAHLSSEVSTTHTAASAAVSASLQSAESARLAAAAANGCIKAPAVVRGRLFGYYPFEYEVVPK